ncbi:MAG: phosphoribosylglycinamide formyltransferase [Anaerolineae bacterium]|nr:phosphoribosylglycinamide formyltransferase [Anaerolineae bacterium]
MLPSIVVMISGEGTNLQVLLDEQAKGELKGRIALVVSNRQNAPGLQRAANAGVGTLYFPLKPYLEAGKTRADYDTDLAEQVAAYDPALIVLAGWMHILGPAFLDRFPQQVINLHPALPGQFPGTDAIRRAFDAFQQGEIRYTGCMVHYVTPEVDAGEVIRQIVVPINNKDTFEDLEARMHVNEHYLILKGVKQFLYELRVKQGLEVPDR